ncbi:MAG: hypothetical protein ACRECA_11860 [Pseudolabrys sp.]
MTARPTTIFTTRTALCLALGAALLVSSLPARAGDDDDGVPIDTKIMRGIMKGLGLKRDGEAGIDYSERAPLVIPPSSTLPPPENSSAAIANNPAWPVDPDVQRQKQEAARTRNTSMNPDEMIQTEASALRPDQLAPGPKPRNVSRTDDGYRPSPNGSSGPLPPSQLGTKGNFFTNMFRKDEPETGSFTGEAPRTALTEPPPGYQTPSPDQPYGVGKAKPVTPTTSDYLRDHPVGIQ